MKNNCLSCRYLQKIVALENRYRCWKEPGVCDHAFIQTEKEANNYTCSNYISNKKTLCCDCRFKLLQDSCSCIKTAKIENDFINLKRTNDLSESCEFFENRKDQWNMR